MIEKTKGQSRGFRMALIGLGLLACLVAPFSASNPVIGNAKQYTVEITASAVALYASLRLINSVLSTAMETEVSGGAVLVSGTIQPLKALEPVDDTVERVASVVFGLALFAGVLSLILAPASGIGLALFGVGLIAFVLMPAGRLPWLDTVFGNARRVGLGIGVVLPLGLLVAFYGGQFLTEAAVAKANTVITSMTDTLGTDVPALVPEPDAGEPVQGGFSSTIESLQNRFLNGAATISGSASSIAESTTRYLELAGTVMARADELFVSFAELLVAYLFQLIVFPALVVLVLWRLLAGLGRAQP